MNEQLDPEMDMTKDMDFVKGSKGIAWWFTALGDIPRDFFRKYVQGKSFLDIGCGDGRILTLAMTCGAKKYHGVELDEDLIKKSNMQRHIKKCDFRKVDLLPYHCIYYFLGSTEKTPPAGEGEPDFIEHIKNFEGVLIVYHRKVQHRLQKFEDNLKSKGFEKIESQGHITVYRRDITI